MESIQNPKSKIQNPKIAHNIETDADVGATFHIEPNHNPRAGETARAWFAIARKGGTLIPLERCNCKLEVYARGTAEPSPILAPSLQTIDAEQYRGIPGANIVFPEAGIYELKLSGSPTVPGEFQPFSLSYAVTVAPGTQAAAQASQETIPTASVPADRGFGVLAPAIAVALLVIFGCLWLFKRRSRLDD